MIVTRFKYPLDKNLVKKIDLMIKRCHGKKGKKDNALIFEGGEGEGKTTFSIAVAYYVSEKTGREFNVDNVFFDVEKMMRFAQETKKQIIVWDEPALQALSTDWASEAVKNITRLLMVARKKRHFFIFNLTKFYKFNEYIVVDRPMALIHVYSRRNVESGRFMYVPRKHLEKLWRDYRFKKKRNYKEYASKNIRGSFPDILNPKYKNNVLKEFNIKTYDKRKDEAIMSIGRKKTTKADRFLQERDNLIRGIKKILKLNSSKVRGLINGWGVPLKSSRVREICSIEKPQISPPTI